jgi:hypothetical protein
MTEMSGREFSAPPLSFWATMYDFTAEVIGEQQQQAITEIQMRYSSIIERLVNEKVIGHFVVRINGCLLVPLFRSANLSGDKTDINELITLLTRCESSVRAVAARTKLILKDRYCYTEASSKLTFLFLDISSLA